MAPQAVMMTGASPRVSLVAYESWRITDPKGACPHSGEDAALEVASLAPSASRGKSGDFCYQEGSPGFGSGPDPETSQSIPMLLADYSIESRHGASFVSWPIRYLSPTLPPPPPNPNKQNPRLNNKLQPPPKPWPTTSNTSSTMSPPRRSPPTTSTRHSAQAA